MTRSHVFRVSLSVLLFAVITGVVALNGINLIEAYGSGAPYYSRTVNMDKWTDPLPTLYVVDSMIVALVTGCMLWTKQKR